MSINEKRIRQLEKRIEAVESRLGIDHKKTFTEELNTPVYQSQEANNSSPSPKKEISADAGNWFTDEPLMKIGAILLVLGVAWFIRYAFVQNWIGPIMRIVLGLGFGTTLMIAGVYFQKTKDVAGQVLLGTGLAFAMVSIYAATSIYAILPSVLALALMTTFIGVTAVVAVTKRKESIAILSLITGAITPFLLGLPEQSEVFILSYAALLNVFAFVLVSLRGWKSLYVLSSIYTVFHTPFLFEASDTMTYVFMVIFGLQFYATITAKSLYEKATELSEVFSSGLMLLTMLGWIYAFVSDSYQVFVAGGVGLLLLIVALLFFAHKSEQVKKTAFLHLVASISYIFASTAFALEGRVLTIALLIEAFLFLIVSVVHFKSYRSIAFSSFLMLFPSFMALSVLDLSPWQTKPFFNNASVLSILTTLIFIASSVVLYSLLKKTKKNDYLLIARIHVAIAWVFSTSYVWFTAMKLLGKNSVTVAIILVLYSVLGSVLLFLGLNKQSQAFKRAGLGILMLVVLRLIFIDVWDMDLGARIAAFIVIGLLLMSTAFFQKQLRK